MGDCISWCNPVFKRVDELPPIELATRNHAYITPDGTAYVLNEAGDGYTTLASDANGKVYDLVSLTEYITVEKELNNDFVTWKLDYSNELKDLLKYIVQLRERNIESYSGSNPVVVDNDSRTISLDPNFVEKVNNLSNNTSESHRYRLKENITPIEYHSLYELKARKRSLILYPNGIQMDLRIPLAEKGLYEFGMFLTSLRVTNVNNGSMYQAIGIDTRVPYNYISSTRDARGRLAVKTKIGVLYCDFDLSDNTINVDLSMELYPLVANNNLMAGDFIVEPTEPPIIVPLTLELLTSSQEITYGFNNLGSLYKLHVSQPLFSNSKMFYTLEEY